VGDIKKLTRRNKMFLRIFILLFLIVFVVSESNNRDTLSTTSNDDTGALSVLPEKEPVVDINEKDDYKVLGLDPTNHLIGEIYSNWLRIKTWPTLSDEQKKRAKDAYHTLLLKHREEEHKKEQEKFNKGEL
jgi:hypothetical protein